MPDLHIAENTLDNNFVHLNYENKMREYVMENIEETHEDNE
jgi:hypothetical protein